jgi:hypothetical protein
VKDFRILTHYSSTNAYQTTDLHEHAISPLHGHPQFRTIINSSQPNGMSPTNHPRKSHMFARITAPPNKAAAPIAPVCMAAASSEVLLLASGLPAEFPPRAPVFSGKPELTAALVLVSAALLEVADGTLEVYGTSLPDEAPG